MRAAMSDVNGRAGFAAVGAVQCASTRNNANRHLLETSAGSAGRIEARVDGGFVLRVPSEASCARLHRKSSVPASATSGHKVPTPMLTAAASGSSARATSTPTPLSAESALNPEPHDLVRM